MGTLEGASRLLWSDGPQRRRGPKPKLTVDQVVEAGIAIADDDGLDAVTMHSVADRLGSAKMALYRYVPGKTELTALMLDRALGLPSEAAPLDWRAALRRWASAIHERALARPWSVELMQRPHVPGPCELQWFEAGLAATADLPLGGAEKLDVLALLVGHVAGIVRQSAESSVPETELAAAMAPILAARAEEFPHTVAAFTDAAGGGRDDALGFGIERILDGVEAYIATLSRD